MSTLVGYTDGKWAATNQDGHHMAKKGLAGSEKGQGDAFPRIHLSPLGVQA